MIVVELPVSNFLPISYQKQVTFNSMIVPVILFESRSDEEY